MAAPDLPPWFRVAVAWGSSVTATRRLFIALAYAGGALIGQPRWLQIILRHDHSQFASIWQAERNFVRRRLGRIQGPHRTRIPRSQSEIGKVLFQDNHLVLPELEFQRN